MALKREFKSFLDLKKECFEILKKERGLEEEYVLLLDRALEHLWFKNEAEYEGRKYSQDALRDLLCAKVTPDILVASVEFLNASKEPIRSPVAYLSKCILGGLVNGFLSYKPKDENPFNALNLMTGVIEQEAPSTRVIPERNEGPCALSKQNPRQNFDGMNGNPSFDANDFFAAAMRNSYGDFLKF